MRLSELATSLLDVSFGHDRGVVHDQNGPFDRVDVSIPQAMDLVQLPLNSTWRTLNLEDRHGRLTLSLSCSMSQSRDLGSCDARQYLPTRNAEGAAVPLCHANPRATAACSGDVANGGVNTIDLEVYIRSVKLNPFPQCRF